jgi:structural maintenance of chromosome 1
VTLVFQDPSGAEVLFSRAILPSAGGDSYASQYRVDGRAVGAEAYTARLESYGILVKARNFLVFQGDIENVAQMQPGDLSRMFEQVCGSVALAPEYAAAEGRVRAAEETTALTFTKKRAITAEKRQKKEQKAEAERHQSLVTEHAQLRTRHALWQIYHIEEDLDAARKEHAAQSKKLAELAAAEADAEAEAEAARREQAGLAKERLLLEKAIKKKRGEGEKKVRGRGRQAGGGED